MAKIEDLNGIALDVFTLEWGPDLVGCGLSIDIHQGVG
jgi:hypothetical protein